MRIKLASFFELMGINRFYRMPLRVFANKSLMCLICLSLPTFCLQAQNFRVASYGKVDGLLAGSLHDIVQDRYGFVWVASENGLARFDGDRFESLKDEPFYSLIKRQNGDLLAAGSNGLWRLSSLPHHAEVDEFPFPVSNKDKKNHTYLFEDSHKHLWAYNGNRLLRERKGGNPHVYTLFKQPEDARLMMAEDEQGLWVFAQSGEIFLFNETVDEFEEVSYKIPIPNIKTILSMGDGRFLFGGNGISEVRISEEQTKVATRQLVASTEEVTVLLNTSLGVLVGTVNASLKKLIALENGDYIWQDIEDHTFPHSTSKLAFRQVNAICLGYEEDVWLTSELGISHLTPNIFDAVDAAPKGYIDAITQLDNGDIYTCQGNIFRIRTVNEKLQGEEIDFGRSFSASIASYQNRLWVGTPYGEVFYWENGKSSPKVNIRNTKGFIFHISADRDGNLWTCQAPNPEAYIGIAKVSPDLKVQYYTEEHGFRSRVLVAKEGKDKKMYFGATGEETYLYVYDRHHDQVELLAVPLPFKHNENFEVHDLDADADGAVWMATTDGLLRFQYGKIERINLGPTYTNSEFRSVAILRDNTVWAATDVKGVVKYSPIQNTHTVFTENNGLTTNISNYRTLFSDKSGAIWIGTGEGLEISQAPNPDPKPTIPPLLLSIAIEGGDTIHPNAIGEYDIPSDTYLTFFYKTLSFSTEDLFYQTRIKELNGSWSIASREGHLFVPDLEPGTYTLEMRAEQLSGHYWSDPSPIKLRIFTVWYRTVWAYCGYLLLASFMVYMIVRLNIARIRRHSIILEQLVKQRTGEILQQKEEIAAQKEELSASHERLSELNNEKNYYISVVAHDLKSPLNRIKALIELIHLEKQEIPEKIKEYLTLIKQSVAEQRKLITDILDLQAIESHSINLDLVRANVVGLVEELSEQSKLIANQKDITVHFFCSEKAIFAVIDQNYLRQIIDNLISNAIKFSTVGKNIYLEVRRQKNRVKIVIQDEGPGISPEEQQMLFRKFQKLSARPTAGERSTGLGLSIVKRFTEAMGGRVWCKSTLGEGTSFIVEFDEDIENEAN